MSEIGHEFRSAYLLPRVPVFLISLPDQENRRAVLLERGIPPEWVAASFQAVDKRGADIETLRQTALDEKFVESAGCLPLAGEIGCALSHREVALWLASSTYDLALVLEDDVVPRGLDWQRLSVEAARSLLPHARSGAAFVCLLGARPDQADTALHRSVTWRGSPPRGVQLFEHVDPERTLWRAHAYLISRGAAKRTRTQERFVTTLADDWGARLRLKLIDELYYTRPVMITQDEVCVSTIDPDQGRLPVRRKSRNRPSLARRIIRSLSYRMMMARARWRARRPCILPAPER